MSDGTLEQVRQINFVIPPNVDANGNPNVVALAVSTTAAAIDLTTIPQPPGLYDQSISIQNPNPVGHFVSFLAETSDVYVLFGPTYASVTSGNKPVIATTNTVSGTTGAVTMAKGVCWHIPTGTILRVKLPIGSPNNPWGATSPWRFCGYVGTTTAVLRIAQSST